MRLRPVLRTQLLLLVLLAWLPLMPPLPRSASEVTLAV
jgi:hypothetical protein